MIIFIDNSFSFTTVGELKELLKKFDDSDTFVTSGRYPDIHHGASFERTEVYTTNDLDNDDNIIGVTIHDSEDWALKEAAYNETPKKHTVLMF